MICKDCSIGCAFVFSSAFSPGPAMESAQLTPVPQDPHHCWMYVLNANTIIRILIVLVFLSWMFAPLFLFCMTSVLQSLIIWVSSCLLQWLYWFWFYRVLSSKLFMIILTYRFNLAANRDEETLALTGGVWPTYQCYQTGIDVLGEDLVSKQRYW